MHLIQNLFIKLVYSINVVDSVWKIFQELDLRGIISATTSPHKTFDFMHCVILG